MSKSMPLTGAQCALVDDADFEWLNQWKWSLIGPGYAGRFERVGKRRTLVYMHRLILAAGPHESVDHINGDRLDNRRENLRLVTRQQNQQNRRPNLLTTSGHKGVTWHKHLRKWHVRITVHGQRLHLGYYEDLERAALLYDAAACYFFGEFACPNYPDRPTPPDIAGLLAHVLSLRATTRPIPPANPSTRSHRQ